MVNTKAYYWVPSLYFFQSIPFAVVSLISLLLYQQIGFSTANIVFITSLLMLPWSLKLFIVPFLEYQQAKKKLIVTLQVATAFLFLILALTIHSSYFAVLSIIIFSLLAWVSATHDIVADALYLTALDAGTQKHYVGIRSVFYQTGSLLVKGGLLIALPAIALHYVVNTWSVLFLSIFGMILLLAIYHHYQLPHNEITRHHPVSIKRLIQDVYEFGKKHYSALLLIFFYNCSIAAMQKIIPLFLIEPQGMGLDLSQIGIIYGIWSTGFFMLGTALSGCLIGRYSIPQSLRWCAALLILGHGLFIGVALFKTSTILLYTALITSQCVTGLANGAYMGYLLMCSGTSEHPMSAYTLCTSLMALSWIFFGALSGILLPLMGYLQFFIFIFVLNLLLCKIMCSKWVSYA